MSFTKAKLTRFNDVPIGSAPDTMYDPKDDMKLPGGIIDKMPRFNDKDGTPIKSCSKSETGSVRSCKSAQLFRTPSIRKQLKKFTLNRIKPKVTTPPATTTTTTSTLDDDTRELLWANRVEIQNKDETIAENEKLLEEQKEEILLLKKQIDSLKKEEELLKMDLKNSNDLSELEREEYKILYYKFRQLVMKSDSDEVTEEGLYVNFKKLCESLESNMDSLKRKAVMEKEKYERVLQEKTSLEKLIEELQFELLAQKKKLDDQVRDYSLKIEFLNEQHDMKIREIESCRVVEKKQIILEYSEKLKELEEDLRNELEMVQQTAQEKLQLVELATDEKCKIMRDEFEKEKCSWQSEFEKCQNIAETEIMQSEFEKLDLQSTLNNIKNDLANEKMKQQVLEKNVTDKSCEIAVLFTRFNQHKMNCEQELKQARFELSQKCNDLYKYELTVNTMRNTIDILSTRLQKSDKDVEELKEQVNVLSKVNVDFEKSNLHYRAELALLQNKLIEYQVTLSNIMSSSRILLENSDVLNQRQEFLKIIDHLQTDTEGKIHSLNNDFVCKIDTLKEKWSMEQQNLIHENQYYSKQLQETQKQLDEVYATLKVLDNVLSNIEIRSRERENLLREKDEKIYMLSQKNSDLMDEYEVLRNEIESYEMDLKGKDAFIDELECELNNVKYDFDDYRDGVNEKLQEFEEIESSSAKRESELQAKIEEQRIRIADLEAQNEEAMSLIGPFREQLKNYENEQKAFEARTEQVTGDAHEIALKYAELLGHQNHKQKLKYFFKIKKENLDLTEKNFQLHLQVQRLKSELEKKQKLTVPTPSRDHSPVMTPGKGSSWKQTPTPSRKEKKNVIPKTPSDDIENIGSPKFNKDLIKHNRVVLGESPVRNDSNKRVTSLE